MIQLILNRNSAFFLKKRAVLEKIGIFYQKLIRIIKQSISGLVLLIESF